MAYSDIKDPSAHFQTLVFTGTGGLNLPVTHTNTGNSDLQPDLIWFKDRGAGYSHAIMDSSRGRAKVIYPDVVNAEVSSGANDDLVSLDTDGFKVGAPSNANSTNGGTTSKVAWQWKANGGTTASNTSGSTTTTVQANQDAGFSIVTYLSNGNVANQTLGHGLGVAPDVIISKRRGATADWLVYHKSLGVGSFLQLNEALPASTTNPPYKDNPTSTVFSTQNQFQATDNFVSYCFAEKQGYSKFGSYKSNASVDGPFIYTGFKPAMIIAHRSSNNNKQWLIKDNARNPSNEVDFNLYPNSDSAETNTNVRHEIDFLSNGFKIRDQYDLNQAGGTFIYMAWAENPFVAGGIPTTAR